MIFSVFDPHTRSYDYFEAPGTAVNYGARGTKYRPLSGAPQGGGTGLVGFAPEALALTLPSNARSIGRGPTARGIIAVQHRQPQQQQQQQPQQQSQGQQTVELSGVPSAVVASLGLGEVPTEAPTPPRYPFGQVLAAACVASIVGVLVQKALK